MNLQVSLDKDVTREEALERIGNMPCKAQTFISHSRIRSHLNLHVILVVVPKLTDAKLTKVDNERR